MDTKDMDTKGSEAKPHRNPEVLGGVALLMVSNAADAAAFYIKAFGAPRRPACPPTKSDDAHSPRHQRRLGDAQRPLSRIRPSLAGAAGTSLHLQIEDIDSWWDRAVKAGAEVVTPAALQFWGDRYGQLRDPFGVLGRWVRRRSENAPGDGPAC